MSGTAAQQSPIGNGSFQQRELTATITLGKGEFGDTGFNTVTLSGLRASATIHKSGTPSMDTAEMRVYGVEPSVMNAVSDLGVPAPFLRLNNTLLIQAGDPVNGMTTVFGGYLQYAWQNFDEMPETMLQMTAYGGTAAAVLPVPPISFPGGADVATIMSGLATQMGLVFENNGVQVQLSSPYFAGTALQQAQKCAKAANIEMYIDTGTACLGTSPNGTAEPIKTVLGTLAIWPKSGTRGGTIPQISAASGMIGYPRWFNSGMDFRTLFNPSVRVGGVINMESSLGTGVVYQNPALPKPEQVLAGGPNGRWYVNGPVVHDLSAQMPGGPWMTEARCTRTLTGTV